VAASSVVAVAGERWGGVFDIEGLEELWGWGWGLGLSLGLSLVWKVHVRGELDIGRGAERVGLGNCWGDWADGGGGGGGGICCCWGDFSGELVLWRLDIVLTFGVPWGASNFVRHA
jgi:hypothetical protein